MNLLANKNNIKPNYSTKLFFKFSTFAIYKFAGLVLLFNLVTTDIIAQNTRNRNRLTVEKTRPVPLLDTTMSVQDTTKTIPDSTSNTGLNLKVEYHAKDSMRFDLRNKKVFLYNEAELNYGTINLKAADVKINFDENILFAEGVLDSTGQLVGKPIFTDDGQEYKSKFMKYNYRTKKAFIKEVFTEDGEGYLHGKTIKKLGDESINVNRGSFTTCNDEDHPHFEFRYKKSKVIPGKKVITGPAYLVIEEVPTPLFIPFGMFPNKQGQRSGILIPTYGESTNRGFYLENGGYYWAINDYLDLELRGDVYTFGSWALKLKTNYIKKYKYNGSLNLTYAINKERDSENVSKDFAFRWQHAQDAKARPNSRFTANVNIVSSQYNVYNPTSANDYLSNTFQSGISYQTKIAGKHSLTFNASHSQNTQSKMVNVTLPEISFSVNRFYPFRKKGKVSNLKWYDNISVNYSMNAKNTVSMPDSLLFKPGFFGQMENGINQSIPISLPLKIFKYFNLTSSIRITDRVYFSSLKRTVNYNVDNQELIENIQTDTVYGLNNIFEYSISSSLSTKLYGMVTFKKGPVRAIRHVFTPSISFSYKPDFSTDKWGYYDSYTIGVNNSETVRYSRFENYLYGGPSDSERGSINFTFANNLEMKVPSRKDTITGMKKVVLIENLNISTSYNLTADSLNWSPVSVSGRTTLFKKLNVNYSSQWNPYAVDEYGNVIHEYEWDFRKKLLRKESTSWRFGLSFNLKSKKGKDKKEELRQSEEEGNTPQLPQDQMSEYYDIINNPDNYVDWNIPWSISFSYNYNKSINLEYERLLEVNDYNIEKTTSIAQTVGISGDLSITPKTKINFRTGYDFENKKISYTSLSFLRNLHCWEMRFNWIPIGPRKSWNFTIAIKSTLLQDLKLEKKKDFRDR